MNSESNSYFSVQHPFSAYLCAWPENQPLPTEVELKSMLPLGLQLINEVNAMEASCLLQLRNLDDEARTVVDYLKLQSKKIDLVLQHILEQQAHEGDKCIGQQFGGSGVSIISSKPLTLGQQYRLTLHIKEALISILCIAQCVECQPDEHGFQCSLEFSQILDEDVEQLVKASLNVQQKQLQQRKKDNLAKG
ncbi:PilZ domain-containing protein [Shewanella sp. Isolate11]|uniref:PilZ domain-containing protein n=1 Tax=Shewanella sp. Isolate11 TaxID=2908530 RepID=UPI001EFECC0F|nr:PilZ domain-containing protein [Shewanella sp. Isolate11]MCG9696948.1 PilZ domain-containing protein [Shewanella sp. Isolate11]